MCRILAFYNALDSWRSFEPHDSGRNSSLLDSKGTWGSERASNLLKAAQLGQEATGFHPRSCPGSSPQLGPAGPCPGPQPWLAHSSIGSFQQLLQAFSLQGTEKEGLVSKPGNRKCSTEEHRHLESGLCSAGGCQPPAQWALEPTDEDSAQSPHRVPRSPARPGLCLLPRLFPAHSAPSR